MRVCGILAAFDPLPSDMQRRREIPAGMIGLRHKSRHKPRLNRHAPATFGLPQPVRHLTGG